MKNSVVFYTVWFVALVVSQILVFNQFELGFGIHIMVYPMFILLLPFDVRPVLLMMLSFVVGITIDWYTNSFGLHTSSAVLLAYVRPRLYNVLEPREGYDNLRRPNLRDMGRGWFITIYLFALLIHHFWFFALEIFKFSEIFFILKKTVLSTISSFLVIGLVQIIFFKKGKSS
jgi:hypothetical protein